MIPVDVRLIQVTSHVATKSNTVELLETLQPVKAVEASVSEENRE